MLTQRFLLALGLLVPQFVTPVIGETILIDGEKYINLYEEPYVRKPMMPRCYHRIYPYGEATNFSHQYIKSLHPNSFTANYDAFSAHLGWCFEHQDAESHNIRKEWDQWWDSTEGDAWFHDLLVKWGILQDPAGESKKGSKSYTQRAVDGLTVMWDLLWLRNPREKINLKPGYEDHMKKVFELITLSGELDTQPLNVIAWKALIRIYHGKPADQQLKDFLTSYNHLGIYIPEGSNRATEFWLEHMVTGLILPAELKRNMERKLVPILTMPVWEIWVATNYEHENGHMVVNMQEGRHFHDEV
ncbi:Protein of unknown function [Pyronema omphalodes CBS 100304]|uniref:Uncharacterized protein n=1 Tax=Pyronema omphalodes (strain CBS 100304) TaxID=1076935 RepID=U4LPL7_PYROM|nr:Protein of unknown function [Pyronema omphalodes CBS 100304]